MEKKIYELQLRKVALSKRIIDRKATERHFRRDQLNEFFDVDGFKSVSHRAPPRRTLSLSPVSFSLSRLFQVLMFIYNNHHISSFFCSTHIGAEG